MSLAVMLSQKNIVTVLDIDAERVSKINNKKSTVSDKKIEEFLENKDLSISATSNSSDAYSKADFIIIATPTNFDETKNYFDTSILDSVVREAVKMNNSALIVIKSTVPIGHTSNLRKNFNTENILFSPEFLREGSALEDNLYPSRIIIGSDSSKEEAKAFANLLSECSMKKDPDVLYMDSTEAESVKLFSNSYLAMRVAFFNELDSFAMLNKLDSKNIIDGLALDPRIGQHYNNPSFGYGGYCLPKDSKQLLSNFHNVPNSIIKAIIESNLIRKNFISQFIISKNPDVVGIHRLAMKKESDNFRESAILDIIMNLKPKTKIVIYEPNINSNEFLGFEVIESLKQFKEVSNLVIANRLSSDLKDIHNKVVTRDLYERD